MYNLSRKPTDNTNQTARRESTCSKQYVLSFVRLYHRVTVSRNRAAPGAVNKCLRLTTVCRLKNLAQVGPHPAPIGFVGVAEQAPQTFLGSAPGWFIFRLGKCTQHRHEARIPDHKRARLAEETHVSNNLRGCALLFDRRD